MSETVSGLVFSFYALVMFISSPLFGKIVSKCINTFSVHCSLKLEENDLCSLLSLQLPRAGAKFLFMAGMFVAGSCNILFG